MIFFEIILSFKAYETILFILTSIRNIEMHDLGYSLPPGEALTGTV